MTSSETHLTLVDGLRFSARTASGRELIVDSPPGPDAAGPSPMELQLVALGGCAAMDVISIVRKMRQDVTSYDVKLTTERAPEHPRVYTRITMTHELAGRSLDEAMVKRAIELTITRYCPVLAMLTPGVDVTTRYRLTDEASGRVAEGQARLLEDERESAT